ncbi:hypothetical protein FOZ63_023438 [Perkinsus olseni]|uniref:RRM domain-containing protein n=1 Tax=Perkinsus olseni TaxID=32597 RepID=A0A7J6U9A0_PEROL|nr:hypothetical protein FOZ63_023438 [Perkinsus olseni]
MAGDPAKLPYGRGVDNPRAIAYCHLGTNEASIRSRFRSLGQRPISVDHFPGKGVSFVYFRDERQCESALAAFQSSGSKMRENDDVQVPADGGQEICVKPGSTLDICYADREVGWCEGPARVEVIWQIPA